jgi:hypothetical protein
MQIRTGFARPAPERSSKKRRGTRPAVLSIQSGEQICQSENTIRIPPSGLASIMR